MVMDFVTLIEDFSNFTGRRTVVSISIFAAVLCLCILVGHLLEEHRWVNESITAILIVGFEGLNLQDYLALGTIFSATDTVCTLQVLCQEETPRLYSLVFGEGVVNDATSVVLFNAIKQIDISSLESRTAVKVFGDFLYLFATSTILGVATGLLTAYALKTLYFGRHSTDREIALMSLMAYLSYMLAEVNTLSVFSQNT
ncbi:Sodium/hydrogen exchanger [Rhynchospora pubera]|uniref:Sodium/hydrogen exchanger n=1 Tax=Rhynchospora pubera TaxID=906938 RepID=A0AAV8CF83_9POAL|nr:Sodium/hydrogen exchanger [Rhynchospora pubera]